MWPAGANQVEPGPQGTANALMTFCQQLGWSIVPIVVGILNDRYQAGAENPAGYAPGMWFYTALSALGLVFSFLLWRSERGPRGHGLEAVKPPGVG
jgi:hypothetical protein